MFGTNWIYQYKDRLIKDKGSITNKFNEFFIIVGMSLTTAILKTEMKPSDYLKTRVTKSFYLSPTTEHESLKMIANLKNSAAGWDVLWDGTWLI